MNFISTPTPPYRSQDNASPKPTRPPGLLGWLASLLRTPTPAYKTAPPTPPAAPEHTASSEAEANAKR